MVRLPRLGRSGTAHNADRVLNRYRDYPKYIEIFTKQNPFDIYHLTDHSYAQLLHVLPAGRVVVTCHDLDAFRCLWDPEGDPRPGWFRVLAKRTLSGLQRAAGVACVSAVTRDAILRHALLPAEKLRVVPNGVAPECEAAADSEADAAASNFWAWPAAWNCCTWDRT